ncbi:MAG TPA: GatB/YqeY domain-containing protein [Atribacteraceae bacterium]|nr:GatB/YqeY domain-containing protein [Atribacteraceae bacterium]
MNTPLPGTKEKLLHDTKVALKEKNKIKLNTLRLVLSELKNEEIAKRSDLNKAEIETILRREIKKRKEAIEYYRKGHREDLVGSAMQEIGILETYLPQALDSREIEEIIDGLLASWDGEPAFGPIMKRVIADTEGRADGKLVSEILRQALERKR